MASSYFRSYIISLLVISSLDLHGVSAADETTSCSCGYYDSSTQNLFTESIIIYFNETDGILPDDFVVDSFKHKFEKGWNSKYRQGVDLANVQLQNATNSSLELYVSPSTPDHLVIGGGIRTTRRDIQYGTFRSLLRSPRQWAGGSALSMRLGYNETESMEINMQNANNPADAWISTLMRGEFPERDLGVNYSILSNSSMVNGTASPWNFTEVRIDWTEEEVRYFIGTNLTRSGKRKGGKKIPETPAPFYLRHWSTGDTYSTEGPPTERSVASVGWTRLFFNSSLMTVEEHENFDARCINTKACSIADTTLRGSSPYHVQATQKWKKPRDSRGKRWAAILLCVISISLSTFLLLHALVKRAPWRKNTSQNIAHGTAQTETPAVGDASSNGSPQGSLSSGHEKPTSRTPYISSNPSSSTVYDNGDTITPLPRCHSEAELTACQESSGASTPAPSYKSRPASAGATWSQHDGTLATSATKDRNSGSTTEDEMFPFPDALAKLNAIKECETSKELVVKETEVESKRSSAVTVSEATSAAFESRPHPADKSIAIGLPAERRVDYLAGLVALATLLVTAIHFGLTFVPALLIPGAETHYASENWGRKIPAVLLLNFAWVGPFFTTSTRFLVVNYLKNGNLGNIAEKAVRRTPRLMIPVAAVALLEYFLIDVGVTKWLEYLPSISWSTWPYVVNYKNFGHYVSEVIEVAYLIPNAAPQIILNYCTGVLWTIPVQLQGSWLVLLGVVVIREIKTPWKRFGYYAFCVVNHWYAQSWGSFLWMGLLLADLDVTYKYKPWLHARPVAYWLFLAVSFSLVLSGMAVDLIAQFRTTNFSVLESDIHPDTATGLPLGDTPNGGYPPYYIPRLNGLFFAVGLQAMVEVSPLVQRALSCKALIVIFPHILTIYLIHGLIFWSLGAWICVHLAALGLAYWLNLVIVAISCYAVMGLLLPVLTPVIETLGGNIALQIWQWATEEPAPRRRTFYPYEKNLILDEKKMGDGADQDTEKNAASNDGKTFES
ncbi:hypothetical protein H2201_000997 [Coniosporium apollinis]|uniref:GH16 domain-containing protein n=1 Tax=Coniosporium apollinis TaxID=61459 RepID=A0ABQ9P797_9PEZI|nr:hypothetical protein H2201_000997 [Coniosporium apollinis]